MKLLLEVVVFLYQIVFITIVYIFALVNKAGTAVVLIIVCAPLGLVYSRAWAILMRELRQPLMRLEH